MIQLTVNGSLKEYDGDPAMPVLWYLRDLLQLTGAKFGCGMGLCGCCTVHVEGRAMRSCVTNMSDVAGKRITTIEGLSAKVDDPYMLDTAHAPRDRNRSRAVRLGEKEARP
jgi:isoquinoline 1-oxidoreductase alpha subunit